MAQTTLYPNHKMECVKRAIQDFYLFFRICINPTLIFTQTVFDQTAPLWPLIMRAQPLTSSQLSSHGGIKNSSFRAVLR